jgi:succinate dehydrogenase / fumarate reductase, cytochrome b subunit
MLPVVSSLARLYNSSIGKKLIVALTGAGLIVFLIGHLLGNLLVFAGAETLNAYAKKLHDLGPLLWVARIGLIAMAAAHIVATVQLTRANRAARAVPYGKNVTQVASRGSRTMIFSGLTILAFLVYHLMHYTWGIANDYRNPDNTRYFLPNGDHHAYNMVIDGFSVWWVSAFYLIAMGMLFMHLGHGFASIFQTLGLSGPNLKKPLTILGHLLSLGLFLGFASMPIAVLCGWIS